MDVTEESPRWPHARGTPIRALVETLPHPPPSYMLRRPAGPGVASHRTIDPDEEFVAAAAVSAI